MTRDDIIRMAREAYLDVYGLGKDHEKFVSVIERFANLVAAEIIPKEALAEMFEWGKDAGRREEREACAKYFEDSDYMMFRSEVAKAIRARGQV